MMEQKIKKLNDWFAAQIELCEQRGQALRADDRADEASFEKVRANVYDIFRTVLSAAAKTCGNDEEAVQCFFLRRLAAIPSGWSDACEKARQHGDPVRVQIETIKLGAVGEIKNRFAAVWEGTE